MPLSNQIGMNGRPMGFENPRPKYQRRHYEAAARELRANPKRKSLYLGMVAMFQADNPRFNESYFHEAVFGTKYRFKSRQSSVMGVMGRVKRLF